MKILTIVTTNPTFIELQYKSINKFVKSNESIEFIVFNDAKSWPDISNFNDINIKSKIVEMCNNLNIQCINIPNESHKQEFNSSQRHADSMNFITQYIINNKDTYFILDNDMFFVDNYNLKDLELYNIAYVEQIRIVKNKIYKYPWPNLFYINTKVTPNLELLQWDLMDGIDTGGKAGGWLLTLDKTKIKKIDILVSCMWDVTNIPNNINNNIKLFLKNDPRNVNGKYFSELLDSRILHYRGGSNWMLNSRKLHNNLTKLLCNIFDKL